MTFGAEGIKFGGGGGSLLGGNFSRWEGMSKFLVGGGTPFSRENPVTWQSTLLNGINFLMTRK